MKAIYKYLQSYICIVVNLIISAATVYTVHQIRVVEHGSYKLTNGLSLLLLLLSAIDVFLVYKDPDSDTPLLFRETIPAVILFIGFIICKIFLRGA